MASKDKVSKANESGMATHRTRCHVLPESWSESASESLSLQRPGACHALTYPSTGEDGFPNIWPLRVR